MSLEERDAGVPGFGSELHNNPRSAVGNGVTDLIENSLKNITAGDNLCNATQITPSECASTTENEYSIFVAVSFLNTIYCKSELELCGDDKLFQSALRAHGALHYFLGGSSFPKHLAKHVGVSESTCTRWINAMTVPNNTTKREALCTASKMIKDIINIRKSGDCLDDIINAKY